MAILSARKVVERQHSRMWSNGNIYTKGTHAMTGTNFCPVCLGSICTTCGHPTPMHIRDSDGERFCTINTPDGCGCKSDPRSIDNLT